jgi:tripartite-type tricarboxylate transporter receptor subunit TctC
MCGLKALSTFALLLVAVALPAFAQQPYPTRPIRVIDPFPPGGAADILPRVIAPKLAERLGQPVIIDNRPGASGRIGMELVARATPDGYTIGLGQIGSVVVVPHTHRKPAYDSLKDFAPVALIGTNYLGVVAYPKASFESVAQMIAWAKANPGKLTVASGGEGTFSHLAFEQLRLLAGFSFTHISYKGSAPATTDIMSGQVLVGIAGYTSFPALVAAGRLRLLAVTNPVRVPDRPELPIVADTVPGFDARGWAGYLAPAATPRAIVARLNDEINRTLKQPDVAVRMVAEGISVATGSPEYFAAMIRSDHARFARLVRDIGYTPQ